MKTTLLLIIACLFVFYSCNNKSEKPNLNKDGYYLIVKINGVKHTFNNKMDLKSTTELSNIINGYNKKEKTRITLGLNLNNNETGTFNLNDKITLVYHDKITFKGKSIYYIWHAKKSVLGSSGTITITENTDTYLEGTFSFKGVGSTKMDASIKNFTEGKFKIKK